MPPHSSLTDRPVTELAAPPSMARLYAKAAVSAIGRGGADLPDDAVIVKDVVVDAARLAAYNRVCGFRLADHLPPTYPHIVAFPLAAHLMTAPAFPFALPGLVHIANRITVHQPISAAERLTAQVFVDNLRPHRRGRQFDIEAVVSAGGEVAWTSTSTYLHREPNPEAEGSAAAPRSSDLPTAATAVWRLPGNSGRRYAAVSGDRNPIHLSALSAKLFGFPKAVAHGMWTMARCLAAVERDITEPAEIRVEFNKPVLLPTTVAFCAQVDGDIAFALRSRDGEALHLHGRITR